MPVNFFMYLGLRNFSPKECLWFGRAQRLVFCYIESHSWVLFLRASLYTHTISLGISVHTSFYNKRASMRESQMERGKLSMGDASVLLCFKHCFHPLLPLLPVWENIKAGKLIDREMRVLALGNMFSCFVTAPRAHSLFS